MGKRLTTKEFIEKAKKVHGDKYDYSKVGEIKMSLKTCIICPIHGEFWQEIGSHLKGCGCRMCAIEDRKSSKDNFSLKATVVHGGKYDYSKVEYMNAHTKVCIVCPIHGEFWQKPNGHLGGKGCPKCGEEAKKNLVYGVGVNDLEASCYEEYYKHWARMLGRCYSNREGTPYSCYNECTVCEEWHRLSLFKIWFEDTKNGYVEGWHLDKDLLKKGNKVYSPETCCFLPPEINCSLTTSKSHRGVYPLGVRREGNYFVAYVSKYNKPHFLGKFDSEQEAFCSYKKAKEAHIKEMAEKYKDKLTTKAYNAMCNYNVEITD